MLARHNGQPENLTTWILIANRSGARIYASDGGIKNLRVERDFQSPEGRMQVTGDFAGFLAAFLEKARGQSDFARLLLICDPKLLGEVRGRLSGSTQACLNGSFGLDLQGWKESEVREKLKQLFLQ